MKNIWRIICVAVFAFGAAFLFQAHQKANAGLTGDQQFDFSDTEPERSFIVSYVDSQVSPDGIVTETGSTVRYVKANGEWRLELRTKNSRSAPLVYGRTSDGVFEKEKPDALRQVSQPSDQSQIRQLFRSHNYLRNLPTFVRTEEVAGLKVYVLRDVNSDPANPEEWLEKSYSPTTGLSILKLVSHMRDGSETRREAVTVEFKEVPEDLNDDFKNLPIKPREKRIQ